MGGVGWGSSAFPGPIAEARPLLRDKVAPEHAAWLIVPEARPVDGFRRSMLAALLRGHKAREFSAFLESIPGELHARSGCCRATRRGAGLHGGSTRQSGTWTRLTGSSPSLSTSLTRTALSHRPSRARDFGKPVARR